jgi:DNA-binding transcriptional LysR family regulator
MDRFDAMRVFTRIVERRSFTLAAEDLSLPRSTVTDAVQQVEKRLGVRLLQRTTRHVSPTLDGEAYYRRCLTILADIEDAEGAFAGVKPKGLLRVDVHGTLARHFVLPGLPRFLEAYPDIEFHMSEGDRLVDLIREGIDCVLRVGVPQDSGMIARRVALLDEVTLASPAYIAAQGVPQHPDELSQAHRMVGFRSSAAGVLPLEFVIDGQIRNITLPATVTVNCRRKLYRRGEARPGPHPDSALSRRRRLALGRARRSAGRLSTHADTRLAALSAPSPAFAQGAGLHRLAGARIRNAVRTRIVAPPFGNEW